MLFPIFQTNKIGLIVKNSYLIHSVDRTKQNKTKQKNTVISYNMAFNKVMVGLKKFTSSNAKLYVYYRLLNFLESFFRSAIQ